MTGADHGPQEVAWSGDPHKAARRKKLVRRLPPLLTALIRVIHATLRYRLDVPPAARRLFRSGRPFILSFWHGRMLILSPIYRMQVQPPDEIWVLISHHWDGEIIARTVRPFGVRAIRGSSTRGGREAYADMLRRIQAGDRVAITPDGPKGPRYRVVQTGILRLARDTGVPVVPVSWSARPRVSLGSWDRFQIPLPWARVHACYGEPILLNAGEAMEVQRKRVETRMNHLTHETETRVREAGGQAFWAAGYRIGRGLVSVLRSPMHRRRRIADRGRGAAEDVRPFGTARRLPDRANGPVWLHADSRAAMAEAIPLAQRLCAEGLGQALWVSGASIRGMEMARTALDGGVPVASFPGGLSSYGRTLRRIRPRLFVLAATGIHPDLLLCLGRQGVPVVLVNGRVSQAECTRARWFRSFYRGVLDSVAVFGMQTRPDALRIVRMGADPRRVHVTGDGPNGTRVTDLAPKGRPARSGGNGRDTSGVAAVTADAAERSLKLLQPWLGHE